MDPRIVKKGKDWHFEPHAGNNLDECIATSITEAKALGAPITLHFNDTVLKVTGESDPVALEQERREQSRRNWDAYTKTPAYKAQQAREKAQQARNQKKIDELMANLDGTLARGIGATVGWMKDYASAAENNTLKTDHKTVLNKVKAAGYQKNAHTGGTGQAIAGNYAAMGEYIIGQAIVFLEKGYPPHPVTGMFADEYERIKRVKCFPVMHQIKLNGKAPPPDTINLVPQIKLKPRIGG